MSSITTDSNSDIKPLPATPAQPTHHLHSDSEPLPGAKGATATIDYSASTMEQTPSSVFRDEEQSNHTTHASPSHVQGKSASNSERPLDVKPTTVGGVATGGRSEPPEGQAGFGDKMIGKTQKVLGNVTRNPEMHEKGELRENGGKAAARGEARAAHD